MRNLRTRTFVTAGIATDAPKMPNRAAIPNGPTGIWSSSRTLRRGDTYSVSVYTPRPTERELAAAGSDYDRPFNAFRQIQLDGDRRRPARRRCRPRSSFPEWDEDAAALRGQAPRPRLGRPRVHRRRAGARATRACGAPGRSRRSSSAARTARSSTSRRSRPTSAAASPTRRPRRPRRARSRASCSRPSRATASSTRARWRCCCGWPASRRAWRPASPRARWTARPTSTSCATSTRTPGSRRGSPTSAGSPSTRRRPSAPPRSQADERGTAAIGDAPDLGGGGALDPRAGDGRDRGHELGR